MTKEEALEILDTIPTIHEQVDALEMAIEALENQKTGHWIEREIEDTMRWKECSECHSEYPNMSGLKYCPNCGAKMEELKGE